MPTKDNELTEKEKTWIRKFRALMKAQPSGIELIVGYSTVDVYPIGIMNKHLGSKHDGWGISANPELQDAYLTSIKTKLIPYTEGF